jgi:hypothetical protein
MPAKLGLDAKLYRNTGVFATPVWDLVGNVRDLTLSLEAGEADVSTRSNNGWRATVGTLKDASLEFEMVWDTADADFTAIRDAFFNNTNIEFAVMDGLITGAGSSGSQGLRATFASLASHVMKPSKKPSRFQSLPSQPMQLILRAG